MLHIQGYRAEKITTLSKRKIILTEEMLTAADTVEKYRELLTKQISQPYKDNLDNSTFNHSGTGVSVRYGTGSTNARGSIIWTDPYISFKSIPKPKTIIMRASYINATGYIGLGLKFTGEVSGKVYSPISVGDGTYSTNTSYDQVITNIHDENKLGDQIYKQWNGITQNIDVDTTSPDCFTEDETYILGFCCNKNNTALSYGFIPCYLNYLEIHF